MRFISKYRRVSLEPKLEKCQIDVFQTTSKEVHLYITLRIRDSAKKFTPYHRSKEGQDLYEHDGCCTKS